MKKKIVLLLLLLLLTGCGSKVYQVQFLDFDFEVIASENLKTGDKIIAPSDPTREGYDFIGWDKEFDTVTNDNIIIKALYQIKVYTVTFIGFDNEVIKTEEVEYNKAASAPSVEKEGYSFNGWDVSFTNIKADTVVKAIFEEIKFTVKFYNNDGEVIDEQIVLYNESATSPDPVVYEDLDFISWDKEFVNVLSDLDIYPIYDEKKYDLKFYDGNTLLNLSVNSYKKSDSFNLPVPVKAGHEFIGWFLSSISMYEIEKITPDLAGNINLYARWVNTEGEILEVPNSGIEIAAVNKNPHSSGTGFVYQPQMPAGIPNPSVLSYTWASSNTQVATISAYSSITMVSAGYAIITGTLNSDPSYILYVVIKTSSEGIIKVDLEEANSLSYVYASFDLGDGTIITKAVKKGNSVIPPIANLKSGYAFSGWETEGASSIVSVNEDTLFTPTYIEAFWSYQGKSVSVLGDSISTFNGYIPDGFSYFYPYPTVDLANVNQTWWMEFINHYGLRLLQNNSWSGSAVAGSAESAAWKKTRLAHLYVGDVRPDVILIFMGANDAASQYITLAEFDAAYKVMLDNIFEESPNSEIILFTLHNASYFSAEVLADYNNVILKYASSYNLKVIRFDQAYDRNQMSNYLADSVHPNKAGMEILADKAISDFYNYIK